jgi:hypothetical protein
LKIETSGSGQVSQYFMWPASSNQDLPFFDANRKQDREENEKPVIKLNGDV